MGLLTDSRMQVMRWVCLSRRVDYVGYLREYAGH